MRPPTKRPRRASALASSACLMPRAVLRQDIKNDWMLPLREQGCLRSNTIMRQLTAHSLAWFLALGLFAASTPALAQEVISLEGIEDDEVIDINKTAPAKKQREIKTGLTGSSAATIEIDEGASAKPKADAQSATTAGQEGQTTGDAQAAEPEAATEVAQTSQPKPKAAPTAQIIDTDEASQGEGEGAEGEGDEEAPAKKKKAERKKRKK